MSKTKLYEYGGLVRVHIVVAATNKAEADEIIKGINYLSWPDTGDIIGVSDVEHFDTRKCTSVWDESHTYSDTAEDEQVKRDAKGDES